MREIGEVYLEGYEVYGTHLLKDSEVGGVYLEGGEVNRTRPEGEEVCKGPVAQVWLISGFPMVEAHCTKFKGVLFNLASACSQWPHTANRHRLQLGCHSGAKGPSQV